MDKTVPAPAAHLLGLIAKTETGRTGIEAYNTIFGHHEDELTKPITKMTVAELKKWQPGFARTWGGSASGAYQIIESTFKALDDQLGLGEDQIFDPDLQDRLAYHLLIGRKYNPWIKGEITDETFMIELAKEWASFPVPHDMQGRHQWVKRGQSYYSGDRFNKALISPEKVKAALVAAKKATTQPPVLDKEAYEMAIPAIAGVLANPLVIQQILQLILPAIQRAAANPTVPISAAEVPAVSQAVAQEIASSPAVQHVLNTEENWYQKRTVWSALFAIATPAVAALTGYNISPEFQEAVIVAIMGIGNAIAAYLAWKAGRPGVRPLFSKKPNNELVLMQQFNELSARLNKMESANRLPAVEQKD